MTKCVLICTAEDRILANLLAQTFGYGSDNFSVALSADGLVPITHYGGYASGGVTDGFNALVSAAKQGSLPVMDMPEGITEELALGLMSRIEFRFNEDWDAVLDELDIQVLLVSDTLT